MSRDDIIRMTKEAGFDSWDGSTEGFRTMIERFASLVAAAEREKVAQWMMAQGYATGHGDTIEDLLEELEWQAKEREREACAKVAEEATGWPMQTQALEICRKERKRIAAAIRARGEK